MSYFLGVDAGGSHTIAVIVDGKGEKIATGISGCGNHQMNRQIAKHSLHHAVEEALSRAKMNSKQIRYSYFGIAGADRPIDHAILEPMIKELSLPAYQIVCDTYIALRAGTNRPYGVVLICGTGVNCAGIAVDESLYQCGGFNYLHGDFGGGSGLANEVYRSVIRSWDGRGEHTLLTELLLDYLQYETVEAMFHHFLDEGKSVPVDVVKLLFTAAAAGDQTSMAILTKQGRELGLSARAVIKRLALEKESFDIVLAGSVLTKSKNMIISNKISEMTQKIAPNSQLVTLEAEPVVGAILLAMEKSNHPITEQIIENLQNMKEIKVG